MVEQNLPILESYALEVATALIDLAQLAQQAGSTTVDNLASVVDVMLVPMLSLCCAERGAVLLGVDEHVVFAHPSSHRKIFRALALHGIDEEEAHALLTTFPSSDSSVQAGPDLTCWITYKLPIGEFMVESGQ